MKQFNTLLSTLAGAALTLASIQANAEVSSDGQPNVPSNSGAIIMLAETPPTARDDAAPPAMGGEGDDAIGGNAPNPEPDRSPGTVVDDASITAEVKTKLLADTKVSGLKIDVDTRGGVVYLTGDNMNSQAAIDQALTLARQTAGVTKVVSKLAVNDVKNQE